MHGVCGAGSGTYNPNSNIGDLDGDGWPDLMLRRQYRYEWYHNDGNGGFDAVHILGTSVSGCVVELA